MGFTTRTLMPVDDPELVRGRQCFTCYENNHVSVVYAWNDKTDRLVVTVILDDGYTRSYDSVAAFPTLETAQIAAETTHRVRVERESGRWPNHPLPAGEGVQEIA